MGLVLWDCTIRNTSIARSGSSPPVPDTPARTTNSSLVAPSSTPKPAPPTPRAGHVRSETGRRLATFASTPSATPAATKSETPADRHRTTPLTNTASILFSSHYGPPKLLTPSRRMPSWWAIYQAVLLPNEGPSRDWGDKDRGDMTGRDVAG